MKDKTFTKEEKFHLDLTMIICKWRDRDLGSAEAMKMLEDLDITYLAKK